MKKIFFIVFALLFGLCGQVFSKEIPAKPSPPRLVNDFAGILSPEQNQALERKLSAYNDSTSTQITIVVENSLEGDDAFDYSIRLAQNWGIGQKDKNNGLLIYIALQGRKIRIQTGYGLEATITDAFAKRIIEQVIKPSFKQQQYYEGLNQATDYVIAALSGQFDGMGTTGKGGKLGSLVFLVILVFIIMYIFSKLGGGGTNYSSRGGSGGDLLTGMLLGSMLSGGSRRSSWGDFSSGGGSFGGFGGGSFGGGGSGGDW